MRREFNITGLCVPDKHYMVDWGNRLEQGWLSGGSQNIDSGNTLFDSMNRKPEDYPELERVISRVLFNGDKIVYNPDSEEIDIAVMFGLVKREGAMIAIANRIFETRLYNRFLTSAEWKGSDIAWQGIS